jgi:hypothetical protein
MGLGSHISGNAVPGRTEWLRRHGLGLACLALVAFFAALHEVAPHAYLFITRIPDGAAKAHPFVDLHDIMQGGACWRQGVDVYAPSACLNGGVFNYSPLLLRAAWLPFGPQDAFAFGLLFCVAYAYALTVLPAAPGRAVWLIAAAAFSPAAYYALEQGNLDVLIFAATVLALRLPRRQRPPGYAWGHAWGYAIFALGAAAKFYPVALFILALREDRRGLKLLIALGLAAGLLGLALYGSTLAAALRTIPSGTPFRASFGRIDLARGLVMLHALPRGSAPLCSWGMALVALGLGAKRSRVWSRAMAALKEDEAVFLVAGAAVTVFCFMAAQNIEYRAIFLLLALPGLIRLAHLGPVFRLLPWVIVLLLWEAVPRAALAGLTQPYLPDAPAFCFWLLREALWWGLIVEFSALALAFVTAQGARLGFKKLT